MIVARLSSIVLGLCFSHPSRLEATGKVKVEPKYKVKVAETHLVRHTRCTLIEWKDDADYLRNPIILAVATVRCDPRDNFCKETGRKLSLAQALRVLCPPLSVEERTKVWATYHGRPRPKTASPAPSSSSLDLNLPLVPSRRLLTNDEVLNLIANSKLLREEDLLPSFTEGDLL